MRNVWEISDFSATVRTFDFTDKAVRDIGAVVYSAEFEDKDADTIFQYLFSRMMLVSFKDQLKRYLYKHAHIDQPFHLVSDQTYQRIIMDSFLENGAPHSFEPVTKKWSAIVKRWLTQDSVSRSTIFLLGFGLRMSPEDVSAFLTKVIKEEDFRLSDPKELIFQYCYANNLHYRDARELLSQYEQLDTFSSAGDGGKPEQASRKNGSAGLLQRFLKKGTEKEKSEKTAPSEEETFAITDVNSLMDVLGKIKKEGQPENKGDTAYRHCMNLAGRAAHIIAQIYQRDEDEKKSGRQWKDEDITPADMEKIICNGIPVNGSGNLQKMSASLLNSHFEQRRFSRQRMTGLKSRKLQVERFDLITLLFFIYSQEREDEEPEVRCRAYIDEINGILRECGMMGLYPVNAYEAFILMCLLAECPLATYSDIWEMSYQEGTKE